MNKNDKNTHWWSQALAWWDRHSFIIGAVVVTLVLMWIAYDVGIAVNMSSQPSLNGPLAGSWNVTQLDSYLVKEKGGVLRLENDKVAKFQTNEGKIYLMPDFGAQIDQATLDKLKNANVQINGRINITTKANNREDTLVYILLDIGTKSTLLILYGGLTYLLVRYWKGGALLGGKKYRHIVKNTASSMYFKDVAGLNSQKREVQEIVNYLKDDEPFLKVGARPIKGVLLYGPPGTGKTLLAKAVAGEAQADFIEQSAASFMELYVGAGAKAVRELFTEARKCAPCVIFIDEIDAMGSSRSGSTNSEYNQTLLALLTEMDGFGNNQGIVVMGATNRIADIDEALLRPGRFDRKIKMTLPGRKDRQEILAQYVNKLPKSDINLEKWTDQTRGFSGAELANLINEATYVAAARGDDTVSDRDIGIAKDKILLGVKNEGRQTREEDLQTIAVHELGHAVTRLYFGQKIEKVSLESRGEALGATFIQIDETYDEILQTQAEINQTLVILMGGRAGEDVLLGKITGGASDDMAKASALARDAVEKLGFSATQDFNLYIPKGPEAINKIDDKANLWVTQAYAQAKQIIIENQDNIKRALKPLLNQEVMSGEELSKTMGELTTKDPASRDPVGTNQVVSLPDLLSTTRPNNHQSNKY